MSVSFIGWWVFVSIFSNINFVMSFVKVSSGSIITGSDGIRSRVFIEVRLAVWLISRIFGDVRGLRIIFCISTFVTARVVSINSVSSKRGSRYFINI